MSVVGDGFIVVRLVMLVTLCVVCGDGVRVVDDDVTAVTRNATVCVVLW